MFPSTFPEIKRNPETRKLSKKEAAKRRELKKRIAAARKQVAVKK